jgi:hypothetical protein
MWFFFFFFSMYNLKTLYIMKKLLLIAALMISAFSFANENNKEIIVEQTIQNVLVVENQITETVTLTADELLRYCWTSTYVWHTGTYVSGMDGQHEILIIETVTTCLTV